jgi:hypothetical protein
MAMSPLPAIVPPMMLGINAERETVRVLSRPHREMINAEIAADRAWYEEMKARSPSRVREKLRRRTADAPDDPVSPG